MAADLAFPTRSDAVTRAQQSSRGRIGDWAAGGHIDLYQHRSVPNGDQVFQFLSQSRRYRIHPMEVQRMGRNNGGHETTQSYAAGTRSKPMNRPFRTSPCPGVTESDGSK